MEIARKVAAVRIMYRICHSTMLEWKIIKYLVNSHYANFELRIYTYTKVSIPNHAM